MIRRREHHTSITASSKGSGIIDIGTRDLWTLLHGMGFGVLFMLAFTGVIAELYRMSAPGSPTMPGAAGQRMLCAYLIGMVALAWLTVLSGAYIVYPWYRAVLPVGAIDLAGSPRSLLLSRPATSGWHKFGMVWKEYVAWIAPIAMTMVAYLFAKYGPSLTGHRELRRAALIFTLAAFLAAGVAGAFGAFLTKYAPIRGGATIHLKAAG